MALQQGCITITGNVGSEPILYSKDAARPACAFRLGCTRRYLDKNGIWQQLPTTWITVKAFRALAMNIMNSMRKGDAVIIVGMIGTEQWVTDDGVTHSRIVIEASNAGHDLNFGITAVRKVQKEPPNTNGQSPSGERQQEAAPPVDVLSPTQATGTMPDDGLSQDEEVTMSAPPMQPPNSAPDEFAMTQEF